MTSRIERRYNISFSYSQDSSLLNNISFNINPNKKYAIVGSSGSGKTTIFNMFLRFYEPLSGEIFIDGIDIRKFDERTIRKHLTVVRQEPILFNTSIKNNLLIVKPDASFEEIVQACKAAYIHDYIVDLPNGYDTVISEKVTNLSVGQKQRIAIARAILKNSKIILFDEATSSLDNESQLNIKKSIDELAINHTIIVIAHRLSTVIDSDEIVVIEDGKIVGRGNHKALINENEKYRQLYKSEIDIVSDAIGNQM